MANKKSNQRNIRKITKSGSTSLGITLPIEILRELKWKEKQRVIVRRKGKSLIITDWKK